MRLLQSQQSHNLACKIVLTLQKGWSARRWGWGLKGAYIRMWPKPNPESNTAIRLYATVSNRCFRKCDHRYSLYIIGTRHRDEALEKTSPKIWWIQKVVVPLHSQLQRKGGRKCPIHDWRLVATVADRDASRASLETCLLGWLEACLIRALANRNRSAKKLLQIFGGFKNLSYLCTHNPQEKSSSLFTGWRGLELELLTRG